MGKIDSFLCEYFVLVFTTFGKEFFSIKCTLRGKQGCKIDI